MAKNHVTTTINNEPVEFLCDTHETMLDVLRNDLGLTGSKEGCGSGDCGACTIMVDGRLACACLLLGAAALAAAAAAAEEASPGHASSLLIVRSNASSWAIDSRTSLAMRSW